MAIDTKQIGNITELEVLTYVTKLGYQVSIPFGDRERYDQIWDINGKLIRVQIKTSHLLDDGLIIFSCRSSHRKNGKCINARYKDNEIDYFATMWNGQCYLVPVNETSTDKKLRFVPPKNCRMTGVSFASQYEVEEVLKNI